MTAAAPAANPFRSARIDQLAYRPPGAGWDALEARFDALDRRAAVVGAHGAGKTRFLATFAARLQARGGAVLAVRATHAAVPPAAAVRGRVLVLDELDALPWPTRWRWRRRIGQAAGAVVASHAPVRWLPTLITCAPDAALVAALIGELTAAPPPPDVAALLARHRGNVRQVFYALYDRAAGRVRGD